MIAYIARDGRIEGENTNGERAFERTSIYTRKILSLSLSLTESLSLFLNEIVSVYEWKYYVYMYCACEYLGLHGVFVFIRETYSLLMNASMYACWVRASATCSVVCAISVCLHKCARCWWWWPGQLWLMSGRSHHCCQSEEDCRTVRETSRPRPKAGAYMHLTFDAYVLTIQTFIMSGWWMECDSCMQNGVLQKCPITDGESFVFSTNMPILSAQWIKCTWTSTYSNANENFRCSDDAINAQKRRSKTVF